MLTPQRRQQMDAVLTGGVSTLTPQRRQQMDEVLKRNQPKSVGGFLENVATSGARAVDDIGQALLHPIETVKNIGTLAKGVYQKFTPNIQEEEKVVNRLGQFYKDRYGSRQKAWETAYQDPVGYGLDVSAVLGGGGALLKGVGKVSGLSALTKAGSAMSAYDPLALAGRGASALRGKINLKPRVLAKAEKTATAGLGNPARQVKIAEKGRRSIGSFIDEYDLCPFTFPFCFDIKIIYKS